MSVVGRLSVRIFWPLANVAGAWPTLATWIFHVQVGELSGTPPLTLFVLVAVRSAHWIVIGTDTVGGGSVSTVAFAVPFEQLSGVKVAVAVPSVWIVACAFEIVPLVAPNAIGTPISTAISAGVTVVLSFLCRKLAVRALVPPAATDVGLAFSDSTSHGLNVSVGFSAPDPARIAVAQGAALGQLLHPKQVLLAVTVPAPPVSTRSPLPPPVPPELPTIRERLTVRLPPAKIPPPPFCVPAVDDTLLSMMVTLLSEVEEFAVLPL